MKNASAVLAKLHEITTAFTRPIAGQPLREAFQEMSARLLDLFDVDHSTITLLDEGRRFFVVEAEYPQLSTPLIGEPIPVQNRATQHSLVARQEPVVAGDLNDHALLSESPSFRQIAQALDIRSLLIVPMVANGNTIGTISLDTLGRNKCFAKEEVELCQTVANQMAAFVAITRLLDEQQKYRRQAGLLEPVPGRTDLSVREEKIAQTLFEKLAKVICFKKASIQLIVEGKRILVGAFGFEKASATQWLLRPVEADPLIRDIVHTQMPKILSKTGGDKYWETHAGTADVNSWIGMPLVFKGETIGILTLDHDRAGFYANISKDVVPRLEVLADEAARDLRDALNLEVAQHQIRALEIIRRFAETVAAKLDPQAVLLEIVSVISKGLGCTRCNIFLVESRGECESLVCRAVGQGTLYTSVEEPVLPSPQGEQLLCPVQRAFQSGAPIFIEDRKRDSCFNFTHELYDRARSMITVPLKNANQVVGTVLAVHNRPGWFNSADQLLLETLARQAASAIERDYGLELVHSIGNEILGATEVDAVLKDVVSGAMKLTHTDSGVIYELNEDCTEVSRSFKPEGSVHPRPRLEDPNGITRTVIAKKKTIEITDIEKDARVNPDLRGQYRSMFAVPLLLGESVVGVLYLNCKNVRGLTETERSLLDTLAGQAALAIQRARLHEKIKDSDATYRSLTEQSPNGIVVQEGGKITLANPAAVRLFGVNSDAELKDRSVLDFIDQSSCTLAKNQLDKLEKGEDVEPMVEMCILRQSKEKVHVEAYTRRVPRKGEIQVVSVFHDLTRTKRVLREMHHRVRRSFSQVNGFLKLQEQFTKDQEAVRTFDTLRGRIEAMALVHSILYQTGKESDVEMEHYLSNLRKALLSEHGSSEQIAVNFSCTPDVTLNEKHATACGLIVTELVANSLLHAFPPDQPSDMDGQVSVSLRAKGDILQLAESDNGIGMKQTPEQRGESMGLSLVCSLVSDDLKGTMKVETSSDAGTSFVIEFAH